jgi:microcystin-dependent protein
MSEPFIAEIRLLPFNVLPFGWAWCDGQLLSIPQNTALFSLLGTTYGGDGKSTFGLPDLRGRAPMHPGQGPGLSERYLGESGGSETVSLLESEIPAHSHQLRATSAPADTSVPGADRVLGVADGGRLYQAASDTTLAADSLTPAGGDQPHNNMQPYLTVRFAIALRGVFPQRPS